MGNSVLSQCRTGVSEQVNVNQLSKLSNMAINNNNQNKKAIKFAQDSHDYSEQLSLQQQNSQVSNLLQRFHLPHRSAKMQEIYQSLIKQKPVKYSIQTQQYLSQYNVHTLNELKDKVLNHKSHKYLNQQLNKISLSSPEIKKLNSQKVLNHINIRKYQLQIMSSFINKTAYREKSLSKSFQFNNEQLMSYQSIKEEIQTNCTPSMYNCQQFDIFNKVYIYIGQVNTQNLPHGSGQLYSLNQNTHMTNYFIEAQFTDGSISTEDLILINSNGSFYRGGYNGYNFNGKGKLSQSKGLTLEGNFNYGLLEGKAKALYPDHGQYEGCFHQGLRQGKGFMIWKSTHKNPQNGTPLTITYDGYFKADYMQGIGNLKTPNYEYWGPFVSNTKEGKGTLKFNDGKKYQGWFEKDQICGYGELYFPDGSVHKGIFPLLPKQ